MSDQTTINVNVVQPRKSMAAAVILAILFGPLGLLYASVSGGLILLVIDLIAIPVSFLTLGIGTIIFPIVWVISIIWAVLAVQGKDQQVFTQIRHGDFSGAAKTATAEPSQEA